MEKSMVVTINDYQRLTGIMELSSLETKMPELAARLAKSLAGAKMLPQEKIARNIITMNSRVLLKDISTGKEAELTITYPEDTNTRERKISVFSFAGTSLLGRRVGDIVSWKVPAGIGEFEILKVTYQPEAVGHYTL